MNQEFVKLEGLGNDFVLIDQRHTDKQLTGLKLKRSVKDALGLGVIRY